MILLSFKLLLSLFLLLSFVRPIFAQESYSFIDEFNTQRPVNTLDPEKWIVYPNKRTTPNSSGCIFDTVLESEGLLKMKQCAQTPLFPYVISKNNPFPDGNFTAIVKFKYVGHSGQGSGIQFVDTAPENGGGLNNVFALGTWETGSNGGIDQPKFRLIFNNIQVAEMPADQNYHEFKAEFTDGIYKLYFDNILYYTSSLFEVQKVKAVYFGDPSLQNPGNWNQLWIDHIKITDNGPSQFPIEPFLDLPWNYGTTEFNQIIYNPNSWFDHKYPLQDVRCCIKDAINFKGHTDNYYKSHSGYDYGKPHGVELNTPVLAAASGIATFTPESKTGGLGHTIKIDHGNGYQTWYGHLRKHDSDTPTDHQLVVYQEGETEEVTKGQIIGLVGMSGNTTGPHIHLSVFKDINGNGDFNDDYPFGLTDPLGWEGNYPDPWEEYTINGRSGAKSYKLFNDLAPPTTQQLPPSGGNIIKDEFKLTAPNGASNEPLLYKINFGPFEQVSELIKSIVPTLFLTATNNQGLNITSFSNPLTLVYDYSKADLSNVNEDSLSFYFFNEQTDLWEKVSSTLDKTTKTISTPTTHFSQFTVMGELLDSTPPITTASISGTIGKDNWYLSDASVSLLAEDGTDGKGVNLTVYSYDGEHFEQYSQPITFNTEGPHKLYFLSHDNVGNEEEIKSVEFSIDKTPPEAKIEVNQTSWDLNLSPVEASASMTKKPGKKLGENIYTITDQAGNTLTLQTRGLDSKSVDVLSINSLKYNNEPDILLPDNFINVNYIFYIPRRRPEIKLINQNVLIKEDKSFIITANILKNKTLINIIENSARTKEELEGLRLLKLQTNQGKLEYSY